MLAYVIVLGVGLLVGLAIGIGVVERDGGLRRQSWRRIAAKRRELGIWERQLLKAAESRGCAGCEIWRTRALSLEADHAFWDEDES